MKNLPEFGIVFLIALICICGCSDDYPDSLYNYNLQSAPTPVITGVEPVEGSFAGVGIIDVYGENFSSTISANRVYFNGLRGKTLAASSTQLRVQVADVVGDSVQISVGVDNAYQFGYYVQPYKLIAASVEFSAINNYVDAYGLACDPDENIYVLDKTKVRVIRVADVDSNAVIYGYTDPVETISGMKMGPGGYLYFMSGISIYRMAPGGGDEEIFARFPRLSRTEDFDFDVNLNIFAAGRGGTIECVKPDASVSTSYTYTSIQFNAVRVYDGYVYVAGTYIGDDPLAVQAGIWRNQILSADGDVGEGELVFDWYAFSGENGPEILSMTISDNGDIFVGMDKENAITIIHADKSTEVLYPEILTPPATYMTWGTGNFLYINRHHENVDEPEKRRVLRIAMAQQSAPYYGRQ
jgi:hypothetical protein